MKQSCKSKNLIITLKPGKRLGGLKKSCKKNFILSISSIFYIFFESKHKYTSSFKLIQLLET